MSEPTTPAETPDAAEPTTSPSFGAHPIVIYTFQRLLLLVAVGGVMYLLGLRGVWLILFAFLLSGFIAMVALRGSREGAAYGITTAVKRVNDRIDESARAEDVDDLDDDMDDLDDDLGDAGEVRTPDEGEKP